MPLTAEQYANYMSDPDTMALAQFYGGPPAAPATVVQDAPEAPAAQPYAVQAPLAAQPTITAPDYGVEAPQPDAPSISRPAPVVVNGIDTTAYGADNPDLASYYAVHPDSAASLGDFLANHYQRTGQYEIANGGRTAGNYAVTPYQDRATDMGAAPNYAVKDGASAPTQSTNVVGGVPTAYNLPITQPLPDGFKEPELMPAGGQYGTSYYAAKTDDGDFAGAVMAAPDQKIRLVDGRTGQVVYEGVGPEGARIAAATANNLSSGPGSGKASWAIQGDTGNGQWTTQAQDQVDTHHQSGLGTLADIALPIIGAILLGPAGAAIGSGISSAAQGRTFEDGALRAVLSAAGAWAAPGIGNAVGSALGSTGATVAGNAAGNLIGNAAADTIANTAIQSLGTTVSEVVVNAAQSIVPQLIAQGVTQAGINAAVNQIAQNVASGRPPTEGVQSEPNTVDPLTVTSPGTGGALPAVGAGVGALTGAAPPNTVSEVVVNPTASSDPNAGATAGALPTSGTPNTVSDVVVHPSTSNGWPAAVGAGVGAGVPALTSTPADIHPPTSTDPSLLYKVEADPLKYIAGVLPLLAAIPGLGGPTGKYAVPTGPAGTRASLDPIFSKGLPTTTNGAGRTTLSPQVDTRYAIKGPEQRFFSSVGQTGSNFAAPTRAEQLMQGIGDLNGDGVSDALDLALFRKRFGAQGFAKGGSTAPRTDYAVKGAGDGRSDSIPAVLSDGEYVVDAETVALLGNGSSQAGAKALDKFRVNVRKHKGKQLARGRFTGAAKAPEKYMAGGRT